MIWYLNILWDYHYGKPGNHLSPYKVIIVLLIIFLMLYIKSLWHIYFIIRSLLLNPLHRFDPTPISLPSGSQQFVLCIWESCSVMSDSLWPHGLYSPWNSPGQSTRVGSYSLLQGIFPTQGLNPSLPHCRWILYQPSHQGSPCIYESASIVFYLLICFF